MTKTLASCSVLPSCPLSPSVRRVMISASGPYSTRIARRSTASMYPLRATVFTSSSATIWLPSESRRRFILMARLLGGAGEDRLELGFAYPDVAAFPGFAAVAMHRRRAAWLRPRPTPARARRQAQPRAVGPEARHPGPNRPQSPFARETTMLGSPSAGLPGSAVRSRSSRSLASGTSAATPR